MNCPHGKDPRLCAVCAPELVARFNAIAEAFAIASDLARCGHATILQAGPYQICRRCGARRALPQPGAMLGGWRQPDTVARAAQLAEHADLSNPWKSRT